MSQHTRTPLEAQILNRFGSEISNIKTTPYLTVLPRQAWEKILGKEIPRNTDKECFSVSHFTGKPKQLTLYHLGHIADACKLEERELKNVIERCRKYYYHMVYTKLCHQKGGEFIEGFAQFLHAASKRVPLNGQD